MRLKAQVEMAKMIARDYSQTQPDFYCDSEGYYHAVIVVNTPPRAGINDLREYVEDKMPGGYKIIASSDDEVTLGSGDDSIVVREVRDYEELNDYKTFCFNGRVKMIKVDFDRSFDHKANYYTPDWEYLPVWEDVVPTDPEREYERPELLGRVIEMAEKIVREALGGDILPFVRVDFYIINGKIYFGEFTLYPGGGTDDFQPDEMNYTIGGWIKL